METKAYQLLSENEQKLLALLNRVPNTSFLGYSIHVGLLDWNVEKFRYLTSQLYSQGRDNEGMMERVIGSEAMVLLREVQTV